MVVPQQTLHTYKNELGSHDTRLQPATASTQFQCPTACPSRLACLFHLILDMLRQGLSSPGTFLLSPKQCYLALAITKNKCSLSCEDHYVWLFGVQRQPRYYTPPPLSSRPAQCLTPSGETTHSNNADIIHVSLGRSHGVSPRRSAISVVTGIPPQKASHPVYHKSSLIYSRYNMPILECCTSQLISPLRMLPSLSNPSHHRFEECIMKRSVYVNRHPHS